MRAFIAVEPSDAEHRDVPAGYGPCERQVCGTAPRAAMHGLLYLPCQRELCRRDVCQRWIQHIHRGCNGAAIEGGKKAVNSASSGDD
jgi:hypothetical protein